MSISAHILLVADDPDEARLIQEQLCGPEGEGEFMLTSVATLPEAMICLERQRVSVLMLDVTTGSGMEGVSQISRKHPDVAIVALTASEDRAAGVRAVRCGVQDFLVKGQPSPESLRRVVRYAIERKRAEKAERDLESLRSTTQSMEQALGVVGHELRTPLAALRACTELLLTEGMEIQGLGFVETMHQEVIRLSEMVDDLLEAARLGNGAARWRWCRDVDVSAVCQGALDVIRRLHEGCRVPFECSVEPPGLLTNGDPDALRRLLLNLLTNALRHTSEGRIAIRARENRDCGPRMIEIEVQDTGEGIPAELVDRLGQPFLLGTGASASGPLHGAGLGLAICKGIVAAHGGRMSFRSTPGQGTTVSLIFAADLSQPAAIEPNPATRRPQAA